KPSSVFEAVGSTIASAPSQRSTLLSLRHSTYGCGLPAPMLGAWQGATAEEPAEAKLRHTDFTPRPPMYAFATAIFSPSRWTPALSTLIATSPVTPPAPGCGPDLKTSGSATCSARMLL